MIGLLEDTGLENIHICISIQLLSNPVPSKCRSGLCIERMIPLYVYLVAKKEEEWPLGLFFVMQVARRPLESEHGDPFTLLNAFDEWVQVRHTC